MKLKEARQRSLFYSKYPRLRLVGAMNRLQKRLPGMFTPEVRAIVFALRHK